MEGPFIPLSQQKARWELADQRAAIERNRYAILELVDRKNRNDENMVAAARAIADLQKSMATATSPIEKQRLKMQISAQQQTIERQTLENMEGAERGAKHAEAVAAALVAAAECETKLAELDKAHGPLTDELFGAISATL